MTEDIRRKLKRAAPTVLPPAPWDSEDLENRARRSIRNRRVGVAGGGLAAVAAVALVVPLVMPGGTSATPGHHREEQQDFSLPDIDDDEYYNWVEVEKPKETAATKKISKVFWKYMAKTYEDLELFPDDLIEKSRPVSEVDRQAIVRVDNELWTAPDAVDTGSDKTSDKDDYPDPELVHTQPVYTLWEEEGAPSHFRFGDSGQGDVISVKVHPKGGFVQGVPDEPRPQPGKLPPHPQYLVEDCSGGYSVEKDAPVDVTIDCEKKDVPGGTVLFAERVESSTKGSVIERTLVLYRDDGTAVVITDTPVHPDHRDIVASVDMKGLLDMAKAIPDVPVE